MDSTENLVNENRRLRRAMRDVVALSTLPAVWIGRGPQEIAVSLAEVLFGTLSLDFVYVRLRGHERDGLIEIVRTADVSGGDSAMICRRMESVLDAHSPTLPNTMVSPWGPETLNVAVTRFGVMEDHGVVVAGSGRSPFPTEQDRLLLSVGANQTAIVVQRWRAEVMGVEQRELLRQTLASIADAVIATDMAGRITFLNPAAQQLTGVASEAAVGCLLDQVYHVVDEQSQEPLISPVQRVVQEKSADSPSGSTLLMNSDGAERPIDESVAPIRNAAGKIIGVVVVFRDVTRHRQAEQEIRRSAERATTIVESITDAFCSLDREWRFTYVNGQAEILLNHSRDELLGRTLWVVYPDLVGSVVEDYYRRAVTENLTVVFDYYYPPHDRWYEVHAYPSPEGLSVYFRDVSERKRADIVLRQSEERFRQLADAMPQIVWSANPDGQIDYMNHRWTEFTGLSQDVGNDGWSLLMHPNDAPAAYQQWATSLQTGQPFEMEIRLLDRQENTYRWHLIRTVAVHDDAGTILRWFGTSTNIHEQKRAAEVSQFLATASGALAGVVDYESTLQKVAHLAVPYFADWSAVDVLNDDGSLRRLAVAHQDAEKINLVHELMRQYPPDPGMPSGSLAVLSTATPRMISDITEDMLVQGARDERHLELLRSLELKSWMGVPLIVSGSALGVLTFATAESGRRYTDADLALATDLAQRAAVAIENNQLYQALRETDRRKDEFLATLAHELRNPLAPIRNALQILSLPAVDGQTARQSREVMERQVHHLVRLVDDLLDVSRVMRGKIELQREQIELRDIVARAIETVQPLIDAQRHQLIVTNCSESLLVNVDPVRLAQVVSNLLTNAAKYTNHGGHLCLLTEREGNMAVLRVRDDGIGIAPSMLPRIFELFMQVDYASTKAQGGLGIGLTLVRNLVEMHNGTVEVHSDGLEQGSEFTVRLPLAMPSENQHPVAPAAPEKSQPMLPGCQLLVVDDNQDAANSLAMLLRLQGHHVRVAFSGVAALEIIQDYTPDVVLMDIGMPGMDGYETARRMRQQPGFERVVLAALTGWGQQEDRRRTSEAGFNFHLVKPPDIKQVEAILATGAPDSHTPGRQQSMH